MSIAGGQMRRPGISARLAGRVFGPRPSTFPDGTDAGWVDRQLAVEEGARSGFFLMPLGLILGTALFHGADLRLGMEAIAVALFGTGLTLWLVRRIPAPRSLAVVGLFTLLGMGLAQIELARTDTTIFSGEATVRIEGRVAWRDIDERGRVRYLIDIERTERPTLSRPPERARIVVTSGHEHVPIGGTYAGLVRLRPPSGPAMPGAYDFAFSPFFQGLGAYGFSLGAPEPAAAVDPSTLSFAERVATVRVAMAERIRSVVTGAEGAVASALITGERAGIPEQVEEWLRVTGLAHVLSISGFHMALIAGFTMLSVRALASAVPGLPLVVSTKKVGALGAFLVSTAYLLIAGDNVATQRSYIMLAIMLGAVLLDRPALTLRNVAIAAMIVLALNPHAVVTASFQMSFAATAALVGAYGALMRWWNGSREERSAPRRGLVLGIFLAVAALSMSSLIAGGATTPYGAYHFQRAAPLGGVIANVMAMPLFSFWIMPLALIAVLAMPFALDAPLLVLMGHGLTLVFAMAERLAAWFPDHATGPMSSASLVLLSAAILALCFLASAARWLSLPLAVAGIAVAAPSGPPPELLIFEDGKELALIDDDGRLTHLKERPNAFVSEQWARAVPQPAELEEPSAARSDDTAIEAAATASDALSGSALPDGFSCVDDVCRAVTHSGIEVAWTEDYEKTGLLCETADVAIVSRAIRLSECRSGVHLVTLRTLRRTGSLAISHDADTGRPVVRPSIGDVPREWNIHRHADWPEYWRNPETDASSAPDSSRDASGARSPDDPEASQ